MLGRFRRRRRSLEGSVDRRLASLERQVFQLEEQLEGLQDAVHRESVRRDEEAADLHRRTTAPEVARALSEDARRRGLK